MGLRKGNSNQNTSPHVASYKDGIGFGSRRRPTMTITLLSIAALLVVSAARPAFATTGDMPYYGGPVMHDPVVYEIYWLPSGYHFEGLFGIQGFLGSDVNYEHLTSRFLTDVGGSTYFNILGQYYDRQNGTILDSLTYGGYYIDTTTAYSSNTPSGQDIANEVVQAMGTEGWTGGLNHLFVIFTASGVYAPGYLTDYCAYHSWTYTSAGQPVVYAYIPDAESLVGVLGCATIQHLGITPNLDLWADSAINLMSHELFESVSDPLINAWGTDESEVADRCAWQFGPSVNLLGADLELKGDYYLVQEEWSNYDNSCVLSYGPNTTISMPLEPSSGSETGTFNFTYSQMGIKHWTLTNSGFQRGTIFLDPNSQITLTGLSTPSGNEKWCFDSSCDAVVSNLGPCSQGSVCLVSFTPIYYYDLIGQTVNLYVNGGGSPSIPVTFATASQSIGTTDSPTVATYQLTTSPQTFWALRGTTASVATSIGGVGERWATTASTYWVIGNGLVPNLLYYHQFLVTFSYNVIGGGGPAEPSVGYIQFGNFVYTTTGQAVWADAEGPYTYPNALPDSTASEQWELSPSSEPSGGSISGTENIIVDYYHQYLTSINYTMIGGTSPSQPTITATYLGQTATAHLPASISFFLDADTSYQISNALAGPTSSERWVTSSSQNAGSVSGPLTVSLTYYHQFVLTLSYSVLGGGSPAPPSLSAVSTGIPLVQVLAPQPTQVWTDENSTYSLPTQLGGSTSTERWVTNLTQTSGVVSGPLVMPLVYYHQFLLSLSYSVDGGGSPIPPTASGLQFGKAYTPSLSTSQAGYWFDAAGRISFPNLLSGSTSSERWISQASPFQTTSPNKVTLTYYHQYFVTVEPYDVNGGTATTSGWFNTTTSIQPSAMASSGWQFEGWNGNGTGSYTGTIPSPSVMVSSAITEKAVFYPGLTIITGNDGSVSYTTGTAVPTGVVQSGESSTVFVPPGITATLTENPSSFLYQFTGWTEGASGTGRVVSVTLNAPIKIKANFSYNYVNIGGIVVAITAVVAVAVYVLRRRGATVVSLPNG